MKQYRRGIYAPVLLLLLGITWGMGYTLARFAMTHGVRPLGYAFWQSVGPGVILLIMAFVQKKSWPLQKKHVPYYLFCGLVGIAIPNVNMFFSAQHVQASILAVVVNTVPIFTVLMTYFFLKKKINFFSLVGVILAIAGMMLPLVIKGIWSDFQWSPWLFSSLISPLCFAIVALYIQEKGPLDSTPIASAAGMMIFSSLLLIPVVLLSHQFYPLLRAPINRQDWVVVTEMLLSSLGYLLFFKLIHVAGAVYYSLVGGVVALTGVFLGFFILHEYIEPHSVVAIVLIILGIFFSSWGRRE